MTQPMPTAPRTMTRTYRGRLPEATAQFQQDAAVLGPQGWVPVSQQYAPGQWGCGAFLVALALCLVLVGLLVFIYMLIVKPAGSLVVVYEWRGEGEPPVPPQDPILAAEGWQRR